MPVDEFDEALNAALHEYSNAEPRIGLEGRVMARVRAPRRGRFGWLLVPAAVAVGIAWFLAAPLPHVPDVAPRFPVATVESWTAAPRTIARPRPKPFGPTGQQLALLRLVQEYPEAALSALAESRHDDNKPIEIEALKIEQLVTEEQTQ